MVKVEKLGVRQKFLPCAPPSNNAEYSLRSKKSTFFRKSRVFSAPGGSQCQKFLSGNFDVRVAKKQQKLPISATNVVFGFRSIFKGLLSKFVEENRGFEGRTPLCLSKTGNKTQKCSNNRFQGRSTVLEGVTSPKSDNGAHFTHFRGKVSFSKSVTFWRWERLSRGTGNPPENVLES